MPDTWGGTGMAEESEKMAEEPNIGAGDPSSQAPRLETAEESSAAEDTAAVSSALKEKMIKSQSQTGTISEALGRRNFLLALGWIAIIAIGVIGEQVKTRWEYASVEGKNKQNKELKLSEQTEEVTDSGLRFVDIKVGAGEQPLPGDLCLVQYILSLEDGTQIISSRDRGQKALAFQLGASTARPDVIPPGLDEGISTMRQGGKRRLIIPPDLGFGDRSMFFSKITVEPNSTLIYEVELVKASIAPS